MIYTSWEQFALIITEFGREYYRENWQRYRDLHPDVDAPWVSDDDELHRP